jgi:hypothetical protein
MGLLIWFYHVVLAAIAVVVGFLHVLRTKRKS